MGMSTHVYGVRAPTERWEAMVACRQACRVLGIDDPPEVEDYFAQNYPGEAGEHVDLAPEALIPYSGEMEEGFEVVVAELTPDVVKVRFVNSW